MDYRIVVLDQDNEIVEIIDTEYNQVFEAWYKRRSKQGYTCKLFQKEAGTIEYAAL